MSKTKLWHLVFIVGFYALLGVGLSFVAGTFQLSFFWAVLMIQLMVGIVGSIKLDSELLEERLRPPQGQDRNPTGPLVLTVLYLLHLVLPALDVGRLHIADTVPFYFQTFGVLATAGGWIGLLWSMMSNKYFSSAIRLQEDRGQRVVTAGPYEYIRHPGYAFASLGFIGESAALGSWLSFLPTVAIVSLLLYRTILEERLLGGDLKGYKDYTQRVPYRWLPGLW